MQDIELWHGDCLVEMAKIADKSADCIICDLPYGVLSLTWDSVIPLDKLWEEYNRILKRDGVVCMFGTEPFSSYIRMSNIKMYKYDYIWVKTKAGNFASCRKVPMKYHENISVFYDKNITYNMPNLHSIKPIKNGRKNKGANAKQCSGSENYYQCESGFNESVLYYSNKSGKGYSYPPTQKPIELIEYLIKVYSNEGDLILDNTAGSMTTAIAAINTNRRCICIEKDDKYFEIGSERVKKHLQEKQLKLF